MYKKYGKRHEQLALFALATLIDSSLKVNVSFAIVAMTNHCEKLSTSAPVLPWTTLEQGLVVSGFFIGYGMFQIPSCFLGSRVSVVNLLSFSFIAAGLLTCLSPVAAIYGGYQALMAVRIATGLVQGIIYPSLKTLLSKWAVPLERSRFYSFVFGGASLGSALTMLWGGILTETWIGWPLLFYFPGLTAISYGAMFLLYGSDSPEEHKSISDWEKQYIAKCFGANCADNDGVPIPWSEILLSAPMWALAITHAAGCWGYWTVLTLTPSYIHKIHGIKWSRNGYLSAIPSFINFIVGIVLAAVDDKVHKNTILTKNTSRKLWNTLAFWGTSGALCAMSLLQGDAISSISLLSFATAINCLTNMGYLMNHTDLSPNFAGALFALTNTFANMASVLGPLISLTVLSNMKEESEWRTVFGMAAIVMFLGNAVFILFGTTDVQEWNQPKNKYSLDKPPLEAGLQNVPGRINIKRFSLADFSFIRRLSSSNVLKTLDVADLAKEIPAQKTQSTCTTH